MSCLVMPSDPEPLHNLETKSKTKAQAGVKPSQRQRRGKSNTLVLQEPLQLKGNSKTGADLEAAQGRSKGMTRTRRTVGEAEMQNIVVELTMLKRDLKQWRLDTERSMPRQRLCVALLCAALCMRKQCTSRILLCKPG